MATLRCSVSETCKISSKNNIKGALGKKKSCTPIVHKILTSDLFIYCRELLEFFVWMKFCNNLKHLSELVELYMVFFVHKLRHT